MTCREHTGTALQNLIVYYTWGVLLLAGTSGAQAASWPKTISDRVRWPLTAEWCVGCTDSFSKYDRQVTLINASVFTFISCIQEARRMPTKNRRDFVEEKVKSEFRTHQHADKQDHIDFLLRFGHVSLDEAKEHVRGLLSGVYLAN